MTAREPRKPKGMISASHPEVSVTFGEHIPPSRIAGMCSSMDAYGFVHDGDAAREFVVEVFRQSKLSHLEEMLTRWETHGFVRWALSTMSADLKGGQVALDDQLRTASKVTALNLYSVAEASSGAVAKHSSRTITLIGAFATIHNLQNV